MYIERLTLSIIIDIDRQHWKSCTAVATSEWHTVKICKHSHNRLIDNIGDYLYFKNQRMEASNLKLIHISSTWDCTTFHNFLPMFQKKKKKIFKNWQVYDWRTKWLIMSGYMDLRRPRVYRRSNVGLVKTSEPELPITIKESLQMFATNTGNAIRRHGSGSTCVLVMACCLRALSNYLNQCWLIISEIQWQSPEGNFTRDAWAIN